MSSRRSVRDAYRSRAGRNGLRHKDTLSSQDPHSAGRRIPNILSLSRILLAVLFIPAGGTARIALICLAGVTDFLDGWLARRTHSTTRWGALVDPIADRIFVLVAIVVYLLND